MYKNHMRTLCERIFYQSIYPKVQNFIALLHRITLHFAMMFSVQIHNTITHLFFFVLPCQLPYNIHSRSTKLLYMRIGPCIRYIHNHIPTFDLELRWKPKSVCIHMDIRANTYKHSLYKKNRSNAFMDSAEF